jgi:hypothetical protein
MKDKESEVEEIEVSHTLGGEVVVLVRTTVRGDGRRLPEYLPTPQSKNLLAVSLPVVRVLYLPTEHSKHFVVVLWP